MVAIGGLSDFAGGFLTAQGTHQDKIDEIDKTKQQELLKVDADKQINDAKEADSAKLLQDKVNTQNNNDAAGQQARTLMQTKQAVANASSATAAPVPGVPSTMGGPIQPRTATVPPVSGQAAQAPITGDINGAAPVPTGTIQQNDLPPTNPNTGTMPQGSNAAGNSTPPAPPPIAAIPPSAPAAQIIGAQQTASAQTPEDQFIAGIKDPQGQPLLALQQEIKGYKDLYGFKAPQLQALTNARGTWPGTQEDFQTKVVVPAFEAQQKLGKTATIPEETLAPNEQERYQALRNTGDLPNTPVEAQPLTAAEHNIRSKNAMVANRVGDAATNTTDSLLRMAGLQGKYESGVGAGTIADFSNTVSSWFTGKESDKAAAAQQMGKESIDAMVSVMQSMPAGTRQGAQMAKYDLQGVPDTVKGAAPDLSVINSMFAKQLMNSQTAYLQQTAGRYEPQEMIDTLTARYKENNPPFLADGHTANPNFMNAKDWLANGAPTGQTTQNANLAQGRTNIAAKSTAANAGQNPSSVGNNQAPVADVPKAVTQHLPPGATNIRRVN